MKFGMILKSNLKELMYQNTYLKSNLIASFQNA